MTAKYLPTANFDGKRFYNRQPDDRSAKSFLKWRLTRKPGVWPSWVDIQPQTSLPQRLAESGRGLVIFC